MVLKCSLNILKFKNKGFSEHYAYFFANVFMKQVSVLAIKH